MRLHDRKFNMRYFNKRRAQVFLCFTIFGFTILYLYGYETCNLQQRVLRSLTVDQAERLVTIFDTQIPQIPEHAGNVNVAHLEHINENKDVIDAIDRSNLDRDGATVADISSHERHETHVLLNSYMRSGSSFMGKILGHRDDAFYYYEPLWTGNVWTYHKGMDEMCSTTIPRCIKKPEEFHVSRSILKNVYSCHLRDIGSKFFENVHAAIVFGGKNSWEQYQICRKIGHDKRYCLKRMEEYCRSRTTRVTKVLRLDLTLAGLILTDNPRLKIVHLFRDPRGTMSSHVFTEWFPTTVNNTRSIYTDAQVYCERVKVDILAAIAFRERYPDRLRGIQYEDFYNLKEKAELLYDYLGMDSSEKYLNFVLSQFSRETKYNATQINKSKLFAYREKLPWKVVQIVEKQCADVINLLGLKLYVNEENYKDPNFSPINGQLRFGLSQV